MRCSKDNELEHLTGAEQALHGVGPDVDASLGTVAVGEAHCDHLVHGVVDEVLNAMNKGFIKVKNNGLLDLRISNGRQVNLDVRLNSHMEVVLHKLERLKSLNQVHLVSVALKKLDDVVGGLLSVGGALREVVFKLRLG